jgi:hypothetical protein
MQKQPYDRYRPTKTPTSDGGGFTETWSEAVTVYGHVEVHDTEVVFEFDPLEDVRVMDLIAVTESGRDVAYYRVKRIFDRVVHGGRRAKARLERHDRPVNPS